MCEKKKDTFWTIMYWWWCKGVYKIKERLREKPTIAELEAILESEDELNIEIQPDGSIRAVCGEPNHAQPKVLTMHEVLESSY